MKKIFVFILIQFTFLLNISAQEISIEEFRKIVELKADKYLTFKGIELKPGLKIDDLLSLLKSKGLRKSDLSYYAEQVYNAYELEGTFFNTHNCKIKLLPTFDDKSVVGIIGVSFPNRDSFKSLKDEYDLLKNSLSEKYYLESCSELFNDDYVESSSNDRLKLIALSRDEATFRSIFYVSNDDWSILCGRISLSISHISVDYEDFYYVSLSYLTSDYAYGQIYSAKDDL